MTETAEPAAPTRLWYSAVCRQCSDAHEMLFSALGDRNEWAGVHVAATGHVVVTSQQPRP